MNKPILFLDAKAELAEGPVWDVAAQRLSWVDIERGELHLGGRTFSLGVKVGAAVPCRNGKFLLGTQNGFEFFDPETEIRTTIADPEENLSENRMNDGKCDAAGRFWCGSISMTRKIRTAAFYLLDHDLSVCRKLDKLTNSNGLGWSPDNRTLYHIDTPRLEVSAFDFDLESATISNRRLAVKFPDGIGRPDGMSVDAEGTLWIAHWSGGVVGHWDPMSGKLIEVVSLPVARVSSCTFGGDDLQTLFITTARHGLSGEELLQQPLAGGIFMLRAAVPGIAATPFGG